MSNSRKTEVILRKRRNMRKTNVSSSSSLIIWFAKFNLLPCSVIATSFVKCQIGIQILMVMREGFQCNSAKGVLVVTLITWYFWLFTLLNISTVIPQILIQ